MFNWMTGAIGKIVGGALSWVVTYFILAGISALFLLVPPRVAEFLGLEYNVRTMFFFAFLGIIACIIFLIKLNGNLLNRFLKLTLFPVIPALDVIVFLIYVYYKLYLQMGGEGSLAGYDGSLMGFLKFLLSAEVRDSLF